MDNQPIDLARLAAAAAAAGNVWTGSPEEFLKQAAEFRPPLEMLLMMEQARGDITRENFFRNPRYKPLKEAWDASVFGMAYWTFVNQGPVTDTHVMLRMCRDDPPDFQLQIGGGIYDFESTRVLSLGEKLGERHAGDSTRGAPYAVPYDGVTTFDPELLKSAVAAKVKRYAAAGNLNLMVYLGTGGRISFSEIRQAVGDGGGAAFSSVWVMAGLEFLACGQNRGGLLVPTGWHRTELFPAVPEGDGT